MLSAMRTALFASLLVLIFGSSPVVFRGCGDDPPPDVPLPPPRPDAGIVCVVDEDCRGGSACDDLRCLAGSCVLVSGDIDRDHDGEAAPPCGNDCDDGDRNVRPGMAETCNGRDDDCDGAIDDGAPPTVTNRVVAGLDGYASLARLGDGFMVAVGNDARALDRYGRVGAPFDVLGDRVVTRTETATAPDGRVIVASILEGNGLAYAVITPGTPPSVAPVVDLMTAGTALDVAVVPHRSSFAMAWSWVDASGVIRLAVSVDVATAEPPFQVASESGYASIATDGDPLVFPDGMGALGFSFTGGVDVTREIGGTLLRHGLASGSLVVALYLPSGGGGGAYAAQFDRGGGRAPLPLFGGVAVLPSDETRLALADGQYVATRAGFGDLHIVTFDSALAGTTLDVALPRSGQTPVSIAGLPGLVGILGATPSSALSAGSDLVLIAECAPPP